MADSSYATNGESMNSTTSTLLSGSPLGAAQVSHADIATFADESVNLKREDAKEYREQVNNLREKLDRYAADHPDTASRKPSSRAALQRARLLRT